MSTICRMVKRFYDAGYYSIEVVRELTAGGKLTPEEYKIITGEDWEE